MEIIPGKGRHDLRVGFAAVETAAAAEPWRPVRRPDDPSDLTRYARLAAATHHVIIAGNMMRLGGGTAEGATTASESIRRSYVLDRVLPPRPGDAEVLSAAMTAAEGTLNEVMDLLGPPPTGGQP